MKIGLQKLKNCVKRPDGSVVAQCPACAQSGKDTTGNHLIVYPDGRFGCVVETGDREHNRQILALVGEGNLATRLEIVPVRAFKAPQSHVLHTVGRLSLVDLGLKKVPSVFLRE